MNYEETNCVTWHQILCIALVVGGVYLGYIFGHAMYQTGFDAGRNSVVSDTWIWPESKNEVRIVSNGQEVYRIKSNSPLETFDKNGVNLNFPK